MTIIERVSRRVEEREPEEREPFCYGLLTFVSMDASVIPDTATRAQPKGEPHTEAAKAAVPLMPGLRLQWRTD